MLASQLRSGSQRERARYFDAQSAVELHNGSKELIEACLGAVIYLDQNAEERVSQMDKQR